MTPLQVLLIDNQIRTSASNGRPRPLSQLWLAAGGQCASVVQARTILRTLELLTLVAQRWIYPISHGLAFCVSVLGAPARWLH